MPMRQELWLDWVKKQLDLERSVLEQPKILGLDVLEIDKDEVGSHSVRSFDDAVENVYIPASIAVTEWSVNGHTGTAFWPDDMSVTKSPIPAHISCVGPVVSG